MSVIKRNDNPQQLQCLGRNGQTKNCTKMKEVIFLRSDSLLLLSISVVVSTHSINPFLRNIILCISVFCIVYSIVHLPHRTWCMLIVTKLQTHIWVLLYLFKHLHHRYIFEWHLQITMRSDRFQASTTEHLRPSLFWDVTTYVWTSLLICSVF